MHNKDSLRNYTILMNTKKHKNFSGITNAHIDNFTTVLTYLVAY